MSNCVACTKEKRSADAYCGHDVHDQFGLEVVASFDDPQASYSFDEFRIWRRTSDGALFYGEDSGCSCPRPFEDVKRIEDLKVITPNSWEAFKTEFQAYAKNGKRDYDHYRYIEPHIETETLDKVRALLYAKEAAR